MTSTFESKHPRARDGKFTGKYRAEAGLELSLEGQPDAENDFGRGQVVTLETLTEDSLNGRNFTTFAVPEVEDMEDGKWYVKEKVTEGGKLSKIEYATTQGTVTETYTLQGHLGEQNFFGYDRRPITADIGPSRITWNEKGEVDGEYYDCPQNVITDHFWASDDPLPVSLNRYPSGQVREESQYRIEYSDDTRELSQIVLQATTYHENGQVKSFSRERYGKSAFHSDEYLIEGEYDEQGNPIEMKYGSVGAGDPVYHRLGGPAIVRYENSKVAEKRFFVYGSEVSEEREKAMRPTW
ncbi:MAG: hypothetical protein E6468_07805 [Varibaculum cambriense]|uniref:hypothetical protein n=1 Tax=Varibaculum cambriense TaxID=184870 RepID=UPI002913FD54|nr:hypothetical protein [Varibaculum cambriense]MDU6681735.1 hypothetical protein [Varibaculum cambriense]